MNRKFDELAAITQIEFQEGRWPEITKEAIDGNVDILFTIRFVTTVWKLAGGGLFFDDNDSEHKLETLDKNIVFDANEGPISNNFNE